MKWLRCTLRVLRHDLTLVSLFVASVVLGAGVFGATVERERESARVEPAPAEPAETPTGPAAAPPSVAAAPSDAETPFVPVLASDSGPVAPSHRIVEGELARGETLSSVLRADGISPQLVHEIATEMGKVYNLRRARPGHDYRVELDPAGQLVEFRYAVSPIERYYVTMSDGELAVRRDEAATRVEVTRIAGVVNSSLHDAIARLGESPQLAAELADLFAWDIDFSRSVHYGDEFRILYERRFQGPGSDGKDYYVGPGRILAARYSGAAGDHAAVYFQSADGRGGYYRPDGSSVERNFLMAPVRYSKITSAFTNARFHPILGIWRPHHGIDYAAPAGTPIWAVADGTVIYRGVAGGFGNLVKIRHRDGYVSYYGHLSRFASGLAEGTRVSQKQLIGYVGSTGLSTGPHVCFRMSKDGRFLDPARLALPTGVPLSPSLRKTFEHEADALLARLDGGAPLVETDEAL